MLIFQILSVAVLLFLFFPATLENLSLNRFRVPATTPLGVGHTVCLVYSMTKKANETTSMQTLTYTWNAQTEIRLVRFCVTVHWQCAGYCLCMCGCALYSEVCSDDDIILLWSAMRGLFWHSPVLLFCPASAHRLEHVNYGHECWSQTYSLLI